TATSEIGATSMAATAITGATVAGGVILAESGAFAYMGSLISTEMGYIASSGPLWESFFASQFTIHGVMESSKYNMLVNGSTNLFGQIAANDFTFDERINLSQTFFASTTKGMFSNFGQSSLFVNYNFDFEISSTSNFSGTLISNSFGSGIKNGFNSVTKPMTNFSLSTKPTFDIMGGSGVEFMQSTIGKELEEMLNKKLSNEDE
ncbi:MAG: hypothetical protein ACK4UK_01555, partial [Flavobacterium sp.]